MNAPLATPTALTTSSERLWDALMRLARIGATPKGGVCRLALSPLDAEGRALVTGWLREAGCTLHTDAIGNVFAIRPGTDADAAPVAMGSHIDTQPNGGRFDGNYGVLAGLEIVRTLNDAGIATKRPIAVAIWTNEEGTRFQPVMMGSGVYAGAFTAEHCRAQKDADGVSVGEALAAIGADGADAAPAFDAYFEAHIEQGPVLEREGKVIGVVESALGQRWFDVVVEGQDAHAGPTPIEMRRDALLAASRLVQAVREVAASHPHYARGTVGRLIVSPNSRNVIPGRVELSIDLRNADAPTLDAMADAVRAAAERIAREDGVSITMQQTVHFPPCAFEPSMVASIESTAAAFGYTARRLASGAGHDAVYVARTCPAAMVFVPCEKGISHNEIENADPAHLHAGANVMLHAVLARANR
ncbi:MAG: Zn-dependent hydrolase [Burkholderiales bacterium]|jgi:N-carbamoyl-L-amino-acid hydrolase